MRFKIEVNVEPNTNVESFIYDEDSARLDLANILKDRIFDSYLNNYNGMPIGGNILIKRIA